VATTRAEDGQKWTAKTGTEIQTSRKTEHWTTKEEMEGPTPLGGLRNRECTQPLTNMMMMMMFWMWKVGGSGIISCVDLLVVTRRTKSITKS